MALLIAAALQLEAVPAATAPVCSLATPRNDVVGFRIISWNREADQIGLIATGGSVWPTRILLGNSAELERPPQGKRWFAFGGENGLVLELGGSEDGSGRRAVTLRRRDDRRAAIPLAFGFCEVGERPSVIAQMDPSADPADIGADIAAFDPEQWSTDQCGLLLSDGRRMSFRFRLTGSDRAEFSSGELWSGRRVTASIRWLSSNDGVQRGVFDRRGGPSGDQTMIIDESASQAAKMIYLRELGDPAVENRSAYGICGYAGIVRRPARGN